MTLDELTAFMEQVEKSEASSQVVTLPVIVKGEAGQLMRSLYVKSKAKGGPDLVRLAADLKRFLALVNSAPSFVSRHFTTASTQPAEAELAVSLAFETKYKKMSDIKDAELQEAVAYNEQGFKVWQQFRQAVSDLKLAGESKEVIQGAAAAGRAPTLGPLVKYLDEVIRVESTVSEVTVESAVEMSDKQKKDVAAAVRKYLPEGKKEANVTYRVNPDILGGLYVTMDNAVVDLSAQTLLSRAAEAVSEDRA